MHKTILILAIAGTAWLEHRAGVAAERGSLRGFLDAYCVRCHGGTEPEAGFSVDSISSEATEPANPAAWRQILDAVESLQMPPEDAGQPTAAERGELVTWLRAALRDAGVYVDPFAALGPARGNQVDHRLLFAPESHAAPGTPDRVWRVTNTAYLHFMERVIQRFRIGVNPRSITPPWKLETGHDFSDYSSGHRVGEAEIAIHLRNCERIAVAILANVKRHQTSPMKRALDAGSAASREQVEALVRPLFERLLDRPIGPAELARYGDFLARNMAVMDADEAFQEVAIAILCQPEVLYRLEPAEGERAPLAPRPLARALAMTLTDQEPDPVLLRAVADGTFASRDDVKSHAQRMLSDPTIRKPRLLGFFREYFGYAKAAEVLKCRTTLAELGVAAPGDYQPSIYVADTDRLIESIIEADTQVLRELLTSTTVFVLSDRTPARAATTSEKQVREKALPEFGRMGQHKLVMDTYEVSLTVDEWLAGTPRQMPAGHRAGVLTHPSWLIAQGTNFENHAIHRGRWIREKLLGGVVPAAPVSVDAALPDEPHHTLRTRMRFTRDAACWMCHRLMDPLGLPFEQYDHLGRHRAAELVVDEAATRRLADPTRGRAMTTAALDTTGAIEATHVPGLDGPVASPVELLRTLADSEHVEQVFVRHVFRYFLGRNETLADGPTLVAAHAAYRDGGGSLKALLVCLLSSDSFVVRTRSTAADIDPASAVSSRPEATP